MAGAWVYQESPQVQKHGADVASWSVGWYDPDGTRRSKSCGSKRNAEKLRRKLEAEPMTGTYQMHTRVMWEQFRREYESRVLSGLAVRTQEEFRLGLNHFKRIVKPVRVFALCTAHIDNFIAAWRSARGRRR